MNAKVEQNSSPLANTAKLALALLVLLGGVFAYYWFSDAPTGRARARPAGRGRDRAGAGGVRPCRAAPRASSSPSRTSSCARWCGRRARRPSQTTLVILVVVVILSIILWLIDMALGKVILDWLLKAKG